jgi:hypothetical protein
MRQFTGKRRACVRRPIARTLAGMSRRLRALHQAFWSFDALLFVIAYTALLLLLPIPKTKLPIAGG